MGKYKNVTMPVANLANGRLPTKLIKVPTAPVYQHRDWTCLDARQAILIAKNETFTKYVIILNMSVAVTFEPRAHQRVCIDNDTLLITTNHLGADMQGDAGLGA